MQGCLRLHPADNVVVALRRLGKDGRLTDTTGPIVTRQPVPALFKVAVTRSEEHTSELQSLMRISYAVFCLKQKKKHLTISTQYKTYTIIHRITLTTLKSRYTKKKQNQPT